MTSSLATLLSSLQDKSSFFSSPSSSSATTVFLGTFLSVSYYLYHRKLYATYVQPYLPSSSNGTTFSSSSSSSSLSPSVVIQSLYVYPVKGMRGHTVPSIEITPLGLLNDRRFVVVDITPVVPPTTTTTTTDTSSLSLTNVSPLGNFITQRSHSRLATFTPYLFTDTMENERLSSLSSSSSSSSPSISSTSMDYRFPSSSSSGTLRYLRLTVDTSTLPLPTDALRMPPSIDIPIVTADNLLHPASFSSSSSSSPSSLPPGTCFRPVQVWSSRIENCIDLGDVAAEFLQYYLNTNIVTNERIDKYAQLRLMYQDPAYHPSSSRKLNTKYIPSWFIRYGIGIRMITEYFTSLGLFTGFADAYPILLGNQVSLNDLNQRIQERVRKDSSIVVNPSQPHPSNDPFYGKQITIHHFRPNIVVDDATRTTTMKNTVPSSAMVPLQPWEEDTWINFEITSSPSSLTSPSSSTSSRTLSPVQFTGVKRCDRCLVTTTDPFTGERGTGEPTDREPLATLSTFRSSVNGKKSGIFFAINILPCMNTFQYQRLRTDQRPLIRVGDTLTITKRGYMGPE